MNLLIYFLALRQSAIPRNVKTYTAEPDVIRLIMLTCLHLIQLSLFHIIVYKLCCVKCRLSYMYLMYRTVLLVKLLLICEVHVCV